MSEVRLPGKQIYNSKQLVWHAAGEPKSFFGKINTTYIWAILIYYIHENLLQQQQKNMYFTELEDLRSEIHLWSHGQIKEEEYETE